MTFMMKKLALAFVVATLAVPALAGDEAPAAPSGPPPAAPTADEIKRVTDYFLRGKDVGPILLDFIACKKTDKVDGKLACVEPTGPSAKKGDPLIAYVKFFAPKGGKYEDLKIKFIWNGEVRSTSDFTVTEAWTGYSNYKQTTASKPGTWEMQVLRGETVLSSQKVTVTE